MLAARAIMFLAVISATLTIDSLFPMAATTLSEKLLIIIAVLLVIGDGE